MKNCANCAYSRVEAGFWWVCKLNYKEIKHPYLQGKKCPCFDKYPSSSKPKFTYPTKEDLENYLKNEEEN